MRKKFIIAMFLLLCAASGCRREDSADTDQAVQESVVLEGEDSTDNSSDKSMKYTKEDMDSSFSALNKNKITLSATGVSVAGQNLQVEDNKVSITEEGTYVVSGTASDAQILINLKENGTVKLVLNNASLTCKEDAPIYAKKGKLILTLAEATSNYIEDSDTYISADENGNPSAAIFSKGDLTGILGLMGKGWKAALIFGVIYFLYEVIAIIMNVVNGAAFSWTSVVGVIIPVLYLWGLYQCKE